MHFSSRVQFLIAATVAEYVILRALVEDELNARVIGNSATNEYVEVLVDDGGRVEDLVLRSVTNGRPRKVLLGNNNNLSAIQENLGWKGMLLIPWAGRIAYGKYEFFRYTYRLPVNELSVDPPIANALHGLMQGRTMDITKQVESETYGLLQLSYSFNDTHPGYPFDFDVTIEYVLSSSGFSMNFYVTNTMESTPMPFYMGWNPYFICVPFKSYVVLDPCTPWNSVLLTANRNPTGKTHPFYGMNGSEPIGGEPLKPTYYDDIFKPTRPSRQACNTLQTRLYDKLTDQMMVLWQDRGFRMVHVYTGAEGVIEIRPMSGMADAYNNHDHLTVLSGGETWTGSVGVYVD